MFKFYQIPALKALVALSGLAALLLNQFDTTWMLIFFAMMVIGNGVAGHRYFGHHQFRVNRLGQVILALLTTFAAYTSIHIWMAQHRQHHRYPDTAKDNHTPNKGFWHSFYFWQFKYKEINFRTMGFVPFYRDRTSVMGRIAWSPEVVFLSRHFVIVWALLLATLLMISTDLFFAYCLAHLIETIRIGIINTCTHMKLPGSYRLYDTRDNSYNNVFIGLLTFGFGWHNTHHGAPGKLILTERWWELDLEGLVGWMFSKIFYRKK
jgi:stearoyl-CoA desaturase (delta-9 desaturase)